MRCMKCSKRRQPIEECKCKGVFCLNCLPYFSHNCTFDWKANKNAQLTNTIVLCKRNKIEQI